MSRNYGLLLIPPKENMQMRLKSTSKLAAIYDAFLEDDLASNVVAAIMKKKPTFTFKKQISRYLPGTRTLLSIFFQSFAKK